MHRQNPQKITYLLITINMFKKKVGLGTGHDNKGGVYCLAWHIPVLDIYVSAPPPPGHLHKVGQCVHHTQHLDAQLCANHEMAIVLWLLNTLV